MESAAGWQTCHVAGEQSRQWPCAACRSQFHRYRRSPDGNRSWVARLCPAGIDHALGAEAVGAVFAAGGTLEVMVNGQKTTQDLSLAGPNSLKTLLLQSLLVSGMPEGRRQQRIRPQLMRHSSWMAATAQSASVARISISTLTPLTAPCGYLSILVTRRSVGRASQSGLRQLGFALPTDTSDQSA